MQRTYNLPDELYNRVKKYAEDNFIDVTTVLKLALNEYLANHGFYNSDDREQKK